MKCAVGDTVYARKGDMGLKLDDFLYDFLAISFVLSVRYTKLDTNGISIATFPY